MTKITAEVYDKKIILKQGKTTRKFSRRTGQQVINMLIKSGNLKLKDIKFKTTKL